jgi:DNA-binding XRE family transcriptional regulator
MSKAMIRKIRNEKIKEVRDEYPEIGQRDIADIFNMSKTSIARILNNRQ